MEVGRKRNLYLDYSTIVPNLNPNSYETRNRYLEMGVGICIQITALLGRLFVI